MEGGGVNIVGRGGSRSQGPVAKGLRSTLQDQQHIKDFTYLWSIVSTSGGTDRHQGKKKKKGTASVCHFKTSVEKQGIKNINTKLRLFNTKVILVGEIFKNTYISSGLE